MRAITEEEFKAWLMHPVTLAMKEILSARREQMRQQWEGGSFTDWDERSMALTNVGNIGTCRGYAFVQELDYEQYLSEIDDGKQVGLGTEGSGGADSNV